MKISRTENDLFCISLSEVELVTIKNCINDAVDLMGEGEFHARVGVERQQALSLVDQVCDFLRNPDQLKDD